VNRIVVVGASLAGMRTVQALRRQGYEGSIHLVGAEPHPPYDRPPLSKRYLAGDLDPSELEICPPQVLAGLGLDLVLGQAATGLDLAAREVELAGGDRLPFDRLVVCTGATPVLPAPFRDRDGVTGFRTLQDASTLRARLGAGARVVVVGGGFIGAEIASTACELGYRIDLVEALPNPMQRVLGAEVGALLAGLHRDRGVRLHTGSGVVAVHGDGPVESLSLADGREIEAEHVVVSVGVRPETTWLQGSGLELGDGVRCDEVGRASGGEGVVFALGDVASWYHARYRRHLRVEHWTSAVEMAPVVAGAILGRPGERDQRLGLPYFWSDQCGTKIQLIGRVGPEDELHVVTGTRESGRFLALYRQGGRATAALGFGRPRELMSMRAALEADVGWADVLAAVPA
jgi:NADPH-dependent 2,4-dienoyl-CoA reductase/sulfur reductase-like enzyme